MNTYEIWVDLQPGVKDLDFTDAVEAFLEHLQDHGKLHSFRIRRRKFGFSPECLGEFNISIDFEHLAQLDEAFLEAATREAGIEELHKAVFSMVAKFRSALYRDFPDAVRVRT